VHERILADPGVNLTSVTTVLRRLTEKVGWRVIREGVHSIGDQWLRAAGAGTTHEQLHRFLAVGNQTLWLHSQIVLTLLA